MTQEQAWGDLVAKTSAGVRPEGYAAPVPGMTSHYPLLGAELPTRSGEESKVVKPWRIRLRLCKMVSPEEFVALAEDVEEIGLSPELKLAGFPLQAAEEARIFVESVVADPERALVADGRLWTLVDEESVSHGPFAMWDRRWRQGADERVERVVEPDGLLLRNLSLLEQMRDTHLSVDSWVVRSNVSAGGTADGLIADTLAYWSGAVAGVDVLEVAQQAEEEFSSLWARLNILRVFRWEAGLAVVPDATSGAGVFSSLRE